MNRLTEEQMSSSTKRRAEEIILVEADYELVISWVCSWFWILAFKYYLGLTLASLLLCKLTSLIWLSDDGHINEKIRYTNALGKKIIHILIRWAQMWYFQQYHVAKIPYETRLNALQIWRYQRYQDKIKFLTN